LIINKFKKEIDEQIKEKWLTVLFVEKIEKYILVASIPKNKLE